MNRRSAFPPLGAIRCFGIVLLLQVLPVTAAPPTIPLSDLFRSWKYNRIKISPDGQKLAGVKVFGEGKNESLGLYTIDLRTLQTRVLYNNKKRLVTDFHWANEDRLVCELWDGRGNAMLWAADYDAESNDAVLTLVAASRDGETNSHFMSGARLLDPLPDDGTYILLERSGNVSVFGIELDSPDNPNAGIYKVNIYTGELVRVMRQYYQATDWLQDQKGEVRVALGWLPNESENMKPESKKKRGRERIVLYDASKAQALVPPEVLKNATRRLFEIRNGVWKPLPPELHSEHTVELLAFNDAGSGFYFLSNHRTDKVALHLFDLETGREEIVYEDPRVDLDGYYLHSLRRKLVGYSVHHHGIRNVWLDGDLASTMEAIDAALPGKNNRPTSFSKNLGRVIIHSADSTTPGEFYLFDDEAGSLEPVLSAADWLAPFRFQPKQGVTIRARDGLELHGYFTPPRAQGKKPPFPLIIYPHGGPWARDEAGFDPVVHFLSDRGYAVLQVDYRGSTGFGRRFLDAGKKQWGRAMQTDLEDAVAWAMDQGLTRPGQVGIFGSSYGGYAALMGLIRTPELYTVGITFSAPTDLEEQFETWRKSSNIRGAAFWAEHVGHPQDEVDLLKEASPIHHIHRIKKPVFLYYGYKDERVDRGQAFMLGKKLRRNRIPYESVSRYDEFHGIYDEENRVEVYEKLEAFLAEHFPTSPELASR